MEKNQDAWIVYGLPCGCLTAYDEQGRELYRRDAEGCDAADILARLRQQLERECA